MTKTRYCRATAGIQVFFTYTVIEINPFAVCRDWERCAGISMENVSHIE